MQRNVFVVPALFLASFLWLTLCMNRNVNYYDEALILFGAVRVFDGAVPHRDFYANYGPGQFYTLAGLYKLFGVSVLVERILDFSEKASTVVAVFFVVDQVAGRWLSLLAAGATLACLGSVELYGYPVFPCLALAMLGTAVLIPTLGGKVGAARPAIAGLCAGLTVLFRYDIGIAVFFVQAVVLACSAWFEHGRFQDSIRTALWTVGWFCAGFAVIVGPLFIAYAVAGVMPDFMFDIFFFPAGHYVKTRSLPFPDLGMLSHNLTLFVVYIPLIACLAATASIIAVMWSRRKQRNHDSAALRLFWVIILLDLITAAFFVKGAVRVSKIHMIMALISCIPLTALLQQLKGFGKLSRGLFVVTLFFLLLSTVDYLHTGLYNAKQNLAWVSGSASQNLSSPVDFLVSGPCRMPPDLRRLACFLVNADTIQTAEYIQQNTDRGDPIFVGLSRHDKFVWNDILLYFAAARPSATKWYHFDPGLQTSGLIQQQMVEELKHVKPKLIVIENFSEVIEPNESAVSSGITILDDYIKDAYEPAATFGLNSIMRYRGYSERERQG